MDNLDLTLKAKIEKEKETERQREMLISAVSMYSKQICNFIEDLSDESILKLYDYANDIIKSRRKDTKPDPSIEKIKAFLILFCSLCDNINSKKYYLF